MEKLLAWKKMTGKLLESIIIILANALQSLNYTKCTYRETLLIILPGSVFTPAGVS